MNPKSATTFFVGSILVVGDIAHEQSDSLVPRQHVHAEMNTEPVATTATYLTASGGQSAFDNEFYSPAIPWAPWLRADASPDVQGMICDLARCIGGLYGIKLETDFWHRFGILHSHSTGLCGFSVTSNQQLAHFQRGLPFQLYHDI